MNRALGHRAGAGCRGPLVVPGAPGEPDVTLVSARPAAVAGPLPVLYYLHGGGMTLELAVVSVEYRPAPHAQYPGPVEDCYAGLVRVAEHAAGLGVDAYRIVIGGKSAGGGLAAALALLTRDRGGAGTDRAAAPVPDARRPRRHRLQPPDAGLGIWDRTSNATAWQALLGDRYGAADLPPYAAPARATDLSGLPPAHIEVGSAETFRDEDVAYANAIWQAGGQAELHVWPGAFHGFDGFAPQAALSRDARDARSAWLRRILARPGAGPADC